MIDRVNGLLASMTGHHRYLAFFLTTLFLVMLACGPLGGGQAEPPAPPVVANATPTLAPTATPDPNAPPTPTAELAPTLAPTADSAAQQGGGAGGDNGDSSGAESSGGGSAGGGGEQNGGAAGGGEGGGSATAACPAGGQNLLTNPSFEGDYLKFGYDEINHAPGWFPWWEDDGLVNLRPEYKPADGALFPNRVHSGGFAQQYFKTFGQFKAGLQQFVEVPTGTRLQFSAYGQAWSCEEFSKCPDATSYNPADMLMRVGIDPRGGDDHQSPSIKWSPYFNPLDQWQLACVEAVSEAGAVTVYLWASPNKPNGNQDVYWDDASLVQLP
ncbi:MAG: hypothetical protein R3300_08540 [Candidatus Promineifilaceae bacterium]|nr:hypothetical protein [Candidatus Promineifilaceae bacterium]